MKPLRTARRRPRYVEHRWTKAGWAYFFCVPSWARKAGCTLHNEALGTDLDAATERAERILLPAFDAWRSGDSKTATTPAVAAIGTLDWVFAEYRADRRYTKLDPKSRRNHENGFKLVGGFVLKDTTRARQPSRRPDRHQRHRCALRSAAALERRRRQRDRRTPHHGQPRDEILPPRVEHLSRAEIPASCHWSIRSRRWGCVRQSARRRPRPMRSYRRSAPRRSRWGCRRSPLAH